MLKEFAATEPNIVAVAVNAVAFAAAVTPEAELTAFIAEATEYALAVL